MYLCGSPCTQGSTSGPPPPFPTDLPSSPSVDGPRHRSRSSSSTRRRRQARTSKVGPGPRPRTSSYNVPGAPKGFGDGRVRGSETGPGVGQDPIPYGVEVYGRTRRQGRELPSRQLEGDPIPVGRDRYGKDREPYYQFASTKTLRLDPNLEPKNKNNRHASTLPTIEKTRSQRNICSTCLRVRQ